MIFSREVRLESWDKSKKKKMNDAITRLETLATQAMIYPVDSAIQRLNKQGLDRNHKNFAKIHTTRRWRTKRNLLDGNREVSGILLT